MHIPVRRPSRDLMCSSANFSSDYPIFPRVFLTRALETLFQNARPIGQLELRFFRVWAVHPQAATLPPGPAAGPGVGRGGRSLDAADRSGACPPPTASGRVATSAAGRNQRRCVGPAPAADGRVRPAVTQALQGDAPARRACADRDRAGAAAECARLGTLGRGPFVEGSPRASWPAEATTLGNTSGHGPARPQARDPPEEGRRTI